MTRLSVCIDRGGTFTDCIGFDLSNGKEYVVKLLSEDPSNYPDAPREGIRRILELALSRSFPRNKPLDTSNIESIRMGTTVATNALLERKGQETALLITKGFKDLLYIGNQARPNIFQLDIPHPDLLYKHVIEVDERVTLNDGSIESAEFATGVTGEQVAILQKPNLKLVKQQLIQLKEKVSSIAICLMHSFTYPIHEQQIAQLAEQVGFEQITVSSEIMPMIKIVPRGNSAVSDAYLTPCIKRYLKGFFAGFDQGIRKVRVEFMQSDGGLAQATNFSGFRAILSGPAAGVVGYAKTSYEEKLKKPVIGFDMGGTSTDVSRFSGSFEHVFETCTAGITIQAPQLDINTVAAGGGSRLFFRNEMFVVGPESAGANPGPVCYKKGGYLAVTDANLFLGRLVPELFPKIFGPNENEALDLASTTRAFEEMRAEIQGLGYKVESLEQMAHGFIQVANESMCRPIRALTQSKGYDTSQHILACFGGAGGQHACAIAKNLQIERILVHRYASVLSAYGLSLADTVTEVQEPCAQLFNSTNIPLFASRFASLEAECIQKLVNQGFSQVSIRKELFLNLRYQGTDTAMMIQKPLNWDDFIVSFEERYKKEFGFSLDRQVIVDDIRVRCLAKDFDLPPLDLSSQIDQVESYEPEASQTSLVYWGEYKKRVETPVFLLHELNPGAVLKGPALLVDKTSTLVLNPDCNALVLKEHISVTVGLSKKNISTTKVDLDPVRLSIFAHRFMSIAEQMGRTLQKTAISTNIKERLDFSCALFGPDGGLVANAPHIPVHLGSMQEAVKWQIQYLEGNLEEGDVICTNHPMAGGSHLPDITVITPVFENGKIVFFVASRGHHADIGGIQPGSMPPNSTELFQEGAAVKSLKIVEKGRFNEQGVRRILVDEPAQYPGCTGTRTYQDNISDLKAQIAANRKGIQLVNDLIKENGLEIVQCYMKFIQENAELAVKQLLKRVANDYGTVLEASDCMDDASIINLKITIDKEQGTAVFDFEDTAIQVYGNTNAPFSVTHSAIIYCLRCLIDLEIPLNQGALNPITIKIPENSLLNPSDGAAVVAGNVLTSQRLCDVIFKAFNACAASQGCCNNLTFGRNSSKDLEGFSTYETIGGGVGATRNQSGRSGCHTHMTNTRITDPEILERRYPVILQEFGLRPGSGGKGKHSGGDGIVREIEFLTSLQVAILSERRVFSPYGLEGGSNGQSGLNLLLKKQPDGTIRQINFGGKNSTTVSAGDRLRIETPGGGGFGHFR